MLVRSLRRGSTVLRIHSYFVRECSSESCPSTTRPSPLSRVSSKMKKPSFAKNLFLGCFDVDFLTFPEALDSEKLAELEAKTHRLSGVVDIDFSAIEQSQHIIRELSTISDCGLYPHDEGLELDNGTTATECIRLCEAIGHNPAVSLLLEYHYSIILKTIEKFGSQAQKDKYCSKLLRGELIGSYALSEAISGFDPVSLKTHISLDVQSDNWKLSGQKIWILNAKSADFFIVFAHSQLPNKISEPVAELSAFIIDKNATGISIEDYETIGLKDCQLSKVNFNEVPVSKDNVLGGFGKGYDITVDNLRTYKFIISSCISGNLKQMLNATTNHLKNLERQTYNIQKNEITLKKFGEITTIVYALDSMLYLTAGIIDNYDIDTSLESAILQIFTHERGLGCINDSMDLLGVNSFDDALPYGKLWMDLMGVSLSFQSIPTQKLFVALIGLQYAGKHLNEMVTKLRNPFTFSSFAIKKMFFNRRQSRDDPALNLELYLQLHPSLKGAAELLEYCVLRLQYATEVILVRFGSESVHKYLDLLKITDVVIDIFAMTSVLSRASRSYCTGIQDSEKEIILAKTYCEEAQRRVKVNIEQIIEGTYQSSEISNLNIGESVFKRGGFFLEHPLKRNIY